MFSVNISVCAPVQKFFLQIVNLYVNTSVLLHISNGERERKIKR